MDEDINGRWNQLIAQLSTRCRDLNETDMDRLNGELELVVGTLQQRYGIARDQAFAMVEEIASETVAIATRLDDDRRADEMMDADFGSSPRPGMDNLSATPVPTRFIDRVEATLCQLGRDLSTQLKHRPGITLLATAALGLILALGRRNRLP